MNLTSKKVIKNLLRKHKIYPSKRLGQNFLIDKNVVKKVIKAAELQSRDIVLEVGPGLGVLTREIAPRVKRVIAVEKDSKMCQVLKETLKDFKNIEIVQGDILKLNSKFEIRNSKFKLVANLPFYITAPTIRKFLETEYPPKEMILIIQKEVAQRICAKPPGMNILAVSVQFYVHPHTKQGQPAQGRKNNEVSPCYGVGARPKIISYISKKSFWPSPKVDSAIIKIVPQKKYKDVDIDLFFKIVKAGFAHPRKQLANNLSKMLKLDKKELSSLLLKNNVQPTQRAETLTIRDWIKLSNMLK